LPAKLIACPAVLLESNSQCAFLEILPGKEVGIVS
jgi:hypothetical protein